MKHQWTSSVLCMHQGSFEVSCVGKKRIIDTFDPVVLANERKRMQRGENANIRDPRLLFNYSQGQAKTKLFKEIVPSIQ